MSLIKRKRYAGKITFPTDFLLRILDLKGGEIHSITMDEYLPHKIVTLVIEHPDMPLVGDDMPVADVQVIHQTTSGRNGVPIKIERIEPPKTLRKAKI